jgi:DNA helicase-2/ATP-dependent DNA helicase PcrA
MIDAVELRRNKFKEDLKDAYINLDYLDSSLSYAAIMLNTTLLDSLENNFDQLIYAREKPYFAKMKMRPMNENTEKEYYIGKISVYENEMKDPLVVDWRSPLASVYYDGRLGEASYYVEGSVKHVELLLKRQFDINQGKLNGFTDVDISVSDAFLQDTLKGHAGNKMKDIVATIQSEQNTIIRADMDKPLIVQGVAGSGKTTIALHRIAYLIYTYSKQFKPQQFMIIAPNNLFLDYISDVLPELGADKVKQTTYIDFMFEILGKPYKLTDNNHILTELLREDQGPSQKDLIGKASHFINSMKMKDLLDCYIRSIENEMPLGRNFKVAGQILVSGEQILKLFHKEFAYLPIYKRISKIKNHISRKGKQFADKKLEELEAQYNRVINRMFADEETESRRLAILDLIKERDDAMEHIRKDAKKNVTEYMSLFIKADVMELYKSLMLNPDQLMACSNEKDAEEWMPIFQWITETAEENFKSKRIGMEDLAPLVYLKKQFLGLEPQDIRFVVIDEAQDFSTFQYYILRHVLETERFTILGDMSQGIHSYRGLESWEHPRNHTFDREVNYLCLEQSYRTTTEIMNLANQVLGMGNEKDLIVAKPVIRHGNNPQIRSFEKEEELFLALENKVESLLSEGQVSIAIIGKTKEECKSIYENLHHRGMPNLMLIDENKKEYHHPVVIIPSYMAKGLEFDAVIIASPHSSYQQEILDIKLLYVAMTRALHQLDILYKKGLNPVLEAINKGRKNYDSQSL